MVDAEPLIRMPDGELPEIVTNPRKSKVWPITSNLQDPQSFLIKGHLVRIWRGPATPLEPWMFRRCLAILECTDLDQEKLEPLGLHWSYSPHSSGAYVLHGHKPGDIKFGSLAMLYARVTEEILYFISKIGGREQ